MAPKAPTVIKIHGSIRSDSSANITIEGPIVKKDVKHRPIIKTESKSCVSEKRIRHEARSYFTMKKAKHKLMIMIRKSIVKFVFSLRRML